VDVRTERERRHVDPPASTVGSTDLREVILGAQDNLINVLATVLGVAIGAGRTDIVALAGLATGLAESISMGGVLYTSTCAERDLHDREASVKGPDVVGPFTKDPVRAGLVTFLAALVAAAIPLVPFAFLSLHVAMAVSALLSVIALFALGGWKGKVTARSRVHDGVQFVVIGTAAALASALIGVLLRTEGGS
jgi:predicted membrane protein (TIGR00267 family)